MGFEGQELLKAASLGELEEDRFGLVNRLLGVGRAVGQRRNLPGGLDQAP